MRPRPVRRRAIRHGAAWSIAVLGAMAMLPVRSVSAEPAAPPSSRRPDASAPAVEPWSAGLRAEEKARAQVLLARGNELLLQNRYGAALEIYRRAIEVWDHPAIRANMAICYINLDKPLAAYESVQLALRYGSAPFDKQEVYAATVNYKKLLEAQIGFLHVRCADAGAHVTLDGHDLLECPGDVRRVLLAGRHQVVAQRPGFLTLTRDFTLNGGKVEEMDLELVPLSQATRMARRWDVKMPFLVIGSGAAVTLLGVLVHQKAEGIMDEYEERLDPLCVETGCANWQIPNSTRELKHRAELGGRVANIVIGAGMVTGITGLVLLYLNRPGIIELTEFRLTPAVIPTVTPGALLGLSGSF